MPRRPNYEIRLRCKICKEFTQSINPIIIKRKRTIDFTLKLYVQFVINLKLNIKT